VPHRIFLDRFWYWLPWKFDSLNSGSLYDACNPATHAIVLGYQQVELALSNNLAVVNWERIG
jgi:hypothetical protein